MEIDKANTLLFYDLVADTLKFSENPGKLGKYLTENIRELIGCRAVLLQYFKQNEIKLLDVCPQRKREYAMSDKILAFFEACKSLDSSVIINNDIENENIQKVFIELEIEQSIYIPLLIGTEKIGALIIHDLLSDIGNRAVLMALQNLAGVIALTLKNALSFQSLEEKVEERTRELKQKNNEYLALNEEYEIQNKDLIKAKEKAEESDRLKTAFLQNMSHEIRTPLNAISGFSGLLINPGLSDEKRKSFVSIIQNSSSQLISIVTDILTISSLETKQEKLTISEVCINDLLVELLAIFKQQSKNKDISLYTRQQLSDKQSTVHTDKIKINQILTNLLSNALRFTHEGFIEFGYQLKDTELEFYVKDTGIGVKLEMQELIFERFRQVSEDVNRNYGGTGLGLSISKAFAELLGGTIWVQSEPDKGSTFYFTISYNPINEIDKSIIPTKRNENFKTVLVAEDEEYNFLLIEALLLEMDLKLIHAKDGKEAVDICKTTPEIDLILMDIKMPVMDGHQAAILIKEFRPDLPIIAQSAYALSQEIKKYGDIFDSYITKPLNGEILVEKVRNYITLK